MTTQNDPIPHDRQAIAKLKDTYLHWNRTQLEKLHSHLHLLKREDLKRPDSLINEIFDLAHNIRGLGGSFGYYLMTDIASSLCKYVHHIDKVSNTHTDIIAAHATAMDMVISSELEGSGGDKGNEIIIRLQKMIAEQSSD